MRIKNKGLGLLTVGVLFTVAAFQTTLFADLPEQNDLLKESIPECVSIDDPLAELFEQEQTRMAWPVKRPKFYSSDWKVAKRRGLQPVMTTLFSIHSKEAVPIIKGHMPPLEVLEDLFRCRGFGVRHKIDTRLVEAILAAAQHFQAPRVHIISAYRSPKFNDALNKKGRRVAAESKHTRGEAIDFSLPTHPARELGQWLWKNFEGGVGTYSRDNFVHIDVGNKRRWRGK